MKLCDSVYKKGYIRRACCECLEFLGYTEAGRTYPEGMDISHGYCPPCLDKIKKLIEMEKKGEK